MVVIWSCSHSEEKYVGEIGKERFIRLVTQDMQVPEHIIREKVVKTRNLEDFEIAYPYFHKVVMFNGKGILKVLEDEGK